MTAPLLVTREDAVLTLTLNRPERRNALNPRLIGELLEALRAAHSDPDVRVIVLAGAGAGFCGGGDLQQMGAPDEENGPRGSFAELLETLAGLGTPTIARVHGHAYGGGLGLVASCDLALAADDARFATPEIRLGLFPFMIMAPLLRRAARAGVMEMILTGEKIDATEAARLGIITRAVPAARLEEETRALALRLAEQSPAALRLGLQACRAQEEMPLAEALRYLEGKLFECLSTEDAQEGIAAFLEKRPPRFTGR